MNWNEQGLLDQHLHKDMVWREWVEELECLEQGLNLNYTKHLWGDLE